jgi:hypothetical protein
MLGKHLSVDEDLIVLELYGFTGESDHAFDVVDLVRLDGG